jgi:hypothetical protein
MPDPSTGYSLVPWVRRGLASLVAGAPTKNYAELPVALAVNGTAVTQAPPQVRLVGPGDITSLDAAAVIRTDPRDGADDFEPNYLATVELALPDLPWLFTPVAADGESKLRPWICLVVVAEGDGVALESRRDGPGLLHLNDKTQLPDLTRIPVRCSTEAERPATAANSATRCTRRSTETRRHAWSGWYRRASSSRTEATSPASCRHTAPV